MRAVGVVAEYNPFHTGHARHLSLTRKAVPPDAALVCCMSGNWVQRGDCAVTDKWRRAAWAVQNGADLVVELPTPSALTSAALFARDAVKLLTALGCDTLSFGCETPDLEKLQALARCLDDPAFDNAIRPLLAQGLSYPAARQQAVETLLGSELAGLLAFPNNNLAVEYLRHAVNITFLPIQRTGAHDGPAQGEFASASSLRSLLREGKTGDAAPWLPQPWEGPVYRLSRLELSILCKLRQLSPTDLEALPDGGDGAGQRLWKAARDAAGLEELWARAKTRRLTEARLRRLTLWAFLDLPSRRPEPEYLRILALSSRGAAYLKARKDTLPLPLITKSADHKELLSQESRLTDIFSLCAPQPLPCGEEFRHSPAPWG